MIKDMILGKKWKEPSNHAFLYYFFDIKISVKEQSLVSFYKYCYKNCISLYSVTFINVLNKNVLVIESYQFSCMIQGIKNLKIVFLKIFY